MLLDMCGCSRERVKEAGEGGGGCMSSGRGRWREVKAGGAGACGRTVRTTALSG